MSNKEFVKPTTCRRCKGEGYRAGFDHVQLGMCFGCDGRGLVEGDKATIAAAKAYAEARKALGAAALAASFEAHVGLSQLEARDPARARKAVASFAAGRRDVVPALAAYFASIEA